jgi:hypothetical protein
MAAFRWLDVEGESSELTCRSMWMYGLMISLDRTLGILRYDTSQLGKDFRGSAIWSGHFFCCCIYLVFIELYLFGILLVEWVDLVSRIVYASAFVALSDNE